MVASKVDCMAPPPVLRGVAVPLSGHRVVVSGRPDAATNTPIDPSADTLDGGDTQQQDSGTPHSSVDSEAKEHSDSNVADASEQQDGDEKDAAPTAN